jgi:aspartate 1-decarboxylase
MQRQMLKSKIHRATVSGCDADYVGSVTVDRDLLDSADILLNEQVHVWDITNGARFVTYAIEGERGSGEIRVNGAAALLVNEGDLVIIASYGGYEDTDLETYAPVVVHVDADNRIRLVDSHPEILLAHGPSGADEVPGALSRAPGADPGDPPAMPGGLG